MKKQPKKQVKKITGPSKGAQASKRKKQAKKVASSTFDEFLKELEYYQYSPTKPDRKVSLEVFAGGGDGLDTSNPHGRD